MTESPPPSKLVSGKLLVFATFAIGIALAGGAWWYNYQQSYRTAEFWRGAAALLVSGNEITLFELGNSVNSENSDSDSGPAGRAVVRKFVLTDRPGLVHLRHSLTYDGNFSWDQRRKEPFGGGDEWPHNPKFGADDWPYALQFKRGDEELVVWFTRSIDELGRVYDSDAGPEVDVLPCPHLGPVILDYLSKVGVNLDAAATAPR
jgi:hypothetical protein